MIEDQRHRTMRREQVPVNGLDIGAHREFLPLIEKINKHVDVRLTGMVVEKTLPIPELLLRQQVLGITQINRFPAPVSGNLPEVFCHVFV